MVAAHRLLCESEHHRMTDFRWNDSASFQARGRVKQTALLRAHGSMEWTQVPLALALAHLAKSNGPTGI
jgi:hypothetical protein